MIALAGYDPVLVGRLARRDRRFFAVVCGLSILASIIVGLGMANGARLTFSLWLAPLEGALFVLLTLNLYRLLHAGTGYPMHLDIEGLDRWRPGGAPALVLFALGFLVVQPLVLTILTPAGGGLITRVHGAWERPAFALPLTLVLAVMVSAPAWLRILMPRAIRNYERERWIEGRLLVDDAYAGAQDAITRLLRPLPTFSGKLETHYADPPYNMRPLVFGLDPALIDNKNIKWVKYKEPAPAPVVVEQPPPAPRPAPPPPQQQQVPKAEPPPSATQEEVRVSFDDPSHDNDPNPPDVAFLDIGRLQVKRARAHIDRVAPFIAQFTGRDEAEVRKLIELAPPDERVHKLFSDYKQLRSILMTNASFALEHGLAPIVSIIVQRPVADVEKRMRAAPPDKRLTGVFAPELARRLLKKA